MLSFRLAFFCTLVFKHWKARLISNLSERIISLPYDSIETLMLKSGDRIGVAPGSAQMDFFRHSSDLTLKKAWEKTIEPNLDEYQDFLQGNNS